MTVPATPRNIKLVAGINPNVCFGREDKDLLREYEAAKTIVLAAGVCIAVDGEFYPEDLVLSQRYRQLEIQMMSPGELQALNMTQNVPPHRLPHFAE